MTSELQSARKALADTIDALALPGVTVLAFEPPSVPAGITVTVASVGMEPTEYLLSVRIYVSDLQPGDACDSLDDTMTAVDTAFPPSMPRSEWSIDLDEARRTWTAATTVQVPREDF